MGKANREREMKAGKRTERHVTTPSLCLHPLRPALDARERECTGVGHEEEGKGAREFKE